MKRARKCVTVLLPVSDRRIQYGYLMVVQDGDAYPPQGGGGGVQTIGPLQLDLDNRRITPMETLKIYADTLSESKTETPRENYVQHRYATGVLRPFNGIRMKERTIDETWDDGPAKIACHIAGTYGVGVGDDGIEIPTISTYFPNSIMRDYHQIQSFDKTTKIMIFRDTVLESVAIYTPGASLYTEFDSEAGTAYMDGTRLEVPTDIDLNDQYQVELHGVRSIYIDGIGMTEEPISWLYQFIPTSPLVYIPADNGTRRTRVENALKGMIYPHYGNLECLMPASGDFLAARDAVESFRLLAINGIAFIKDLMALKSFLDPVLRIIRKPTSPKAWAQLLLWWKYGVKLGSSDCKAILKVFIQTKRLHKSLAHYRKSRLSYQTRYGTSIVDVQPNTFFVWAKCRSNARVRAKPVFPSCMDSLDMLVNDMNIRLSATNMWDLIPFSFVVDWFINIGDICANIDYSADLVNLKLKDYVRSSKCFGDLVDTAFLNTEFNLFGSLYLESYTRGPSNFLPHAPIGLGAPTFINHTWEGFLILLSKVSKK